MRHIQFGKNFKPITGVGKYNIHGKILKPVYYYEAKLRWEVGSRPIYPPNKPTKQTQQNHNKTTE